MAKNQLISISPDEEEEEEVTPRAATSKVKGKGKTIPKSTPAFSSSSSSFKDLNNITFASTYKSKPIQSTSSSKLNPKSNPKPKLKSTAITDNEEKEKGKGTITTSVPKPQQSKKKKFQSHKSDSKSTTSIPQKAVPNKPNPKKRLRVPTSEEEEGEEQQGIEEEEEQGEEHDDDDNESDGEDDEEMGQKRRRVSDSRKKKGKGLEKDAKTNDKGKGKAKAKAKPSSSSKKRKRKRELSPESSGSGSDSTSSSNASSLMEEIEELPDTDSDHKREERFRRPVVKKKTRKLNDYKQKFQQRQKEKKKREADLKRAGIVIDDDDDNRSAPRKLRRPKLQRRRYSTSNESGSDSDEGESESDTTTSSEEEVDEEGNLRDFIDTSKTKEAKEVREFKMATWGKTKPLSEHFKIFVNYLALQFLRPELNWVEEDLSYDMSETRLADRFDGMASQKVSSLWDPDFLRALDIYASYEIHNLSEWEDLCEACQRRHRVKVAIEMKGQAYNSARLEPLQIPQGKKAKKQFDSYPTSFNLGDECRNKAEEYHQLKHWRWWIQRGITQEWKSFIQNHPNITKEKLKKKSIFEKVREPFLDQCQNSIRVNKICSVLESKL